MRGGEGPEDELEELGRHASWKLPRTSGVLPILAATPRTYVLLVLLRLKTEESSGQPPLAGPFLIPIVGVTFAADSSGERLWRRRRCALGREITQGHNMVREIITIFVRAIRGAHRKVHGG